MILEAGGGNPRLSWYKVQPRVAAFTRVCGYDRAGLGWSDPSPKPRTAKVIAEELHTLLHNAGINGPLLLVGHSLGGMDARMFANIPTKWWAWCRWTLHIPIRMIGFRRKPRSCRTASYYVIRVMQFTLPIGLPRLLASRSVPARSSARVLCSLLPATVPRCGPR